MTQRDEDAICTVGPAEATESGLEVYAFHLSRYASGWLTAEGWDCAWVTIGFERVVGDPVTFEIRRDGCRPTEVDWDFQDLCHAYRSGDGRLRLERREEDAAPEIYEVLPILDRPATGGKPTVITGFVILPEIGANLPDEVTILREKVGEAIQAARRNGVRMFFDDGEARPIKPFLYELMDHLPEWVGCDHSASLMMTSTLETMALEASQHGRFDVLAERIYADPADVEEVDRLVGMSILLDGEGTELLQEVVERQRTDSELPYHIYDSVGDGEWLGRDLEEPVAGEFHRLESRPDQESYVFVPLIVREREQTELLGFMALGFRERVELSSGDGELLRSLAARLAHTLRYSPLYTLGAQKLWMLRRTRALIEEAVAGAEDEETVDELVEGVTSLVAHQGAVPSFAVGRVERDDDGGRELHYVHPHGWTHYDELRLPVDVAPEERAGSGVSALAVRLNRRFVLAGGRGSGEEQEFKNYLQVDESTGEVVDERRREAKARDFGDDWMRLSDYYKPARWRAYATLAYPISFGDEVLGVLTIEVEKGTDWGWWTGFGGQLFWEMLADELASAFWALR